MNSSYKHYLKLVLLITIVVIPYTVFASEYDVTTIPINSYTPRSMIPLGTKVYVVNDSGNNLSVIDSSDNSVSTIPVGSGPINITAIGSVLYVPNNAGNTVTRIDTANGNSTSNITVNQYPLSIISLGTKIYTASQNRGTVSIINTASGNSVSTVTVGSQPAAMVGLGTNVYVANYGGSSVSIIYSNNSVSTIPVGLWPTAIASLGTKVYVANYGSSTVSIIDTANGNSVSTVSVPANPQGFAVIGNLVYVACSVPNNVSDPVVKSNSKIAVIDTMNGNSVNNIIVDPYVRRLQVLGATLFAYHYDNSVGHSLVSAINTANGNSVSRIAIPAAPSGITALDDKVYVSHYQANTVSIISLKNSLSVITSSPGDIDSGIRIKQADGTIVAIAGSTTLSASKLHIKGTPTQVLSVLYVATSSPDATKAHIKLADGTIKALKKYSGANSGVTNGFVLNPQTGLFYQTLSITNTGAADVQSVRLTLDSLVPNLPGENIFVYGISGTDSSGKKYIQYNYPLGAGQSMNFTVSIQSPSRRGAVATYSASPSAPISEPSVPAGSIQLNPIGPIIPQIYGGKDKLLINFNSVLGSKYGLQYSDDAGSNWHSWYGDNSTLYFLTAGANIVQLVDFGPPHTMYTSSPLTRIYKVYKLP